MSITRSIVRLRSAMRAGAALSLGLLAACAERGPPPSLGPRGGEPVTVIVQRGDTLSSIARRHGVPMQPVAAANGLAPPYVIRPGQVLHVPGAGAAPPTPPVPVAAHASALGAAAPPAEPVAALPAPPPTRPPEGVASRSVTAEALPPPPGGPPASHPPSQPPSPAASPARIASAAAAASVSGALPLPPPSVALPPAEAAPGRVEPARAAARPTAEPPTRRLPPGRFAWPVNGQVVSGFGSKGGGLVNDGVNIAAPRGTPVRAAGDGTVIYAGNEVRGFGNLMLVRHEGGWVTAYGHAERMLVRQGQQVRLGQEIARVGSTGAVATPQLHFQVRRDGRPVDPAAHLERRVAER